MPYNKYPSCDIDLTRQKHIAVLQRHNEWLQAELWKLRESNSNRLMRNYLIMSWVIVVLSLYPYL